MANPETVTAITSVGSVPRDDNDSPITSLGLQATKTITLSGNNDTIVTPVFTVTGDVHILGIYGVVTTDFGANHTAAYLRLNDQTAQPDITLNTGTTLSAIKVGSAILKKGLAGAAITLLNNSAGRVSEPTTLETLYFSPFVVVKKTGALTQIEYVYTTTDTPTTGALQFFAQYIPLSAGATLTAA